MTTINANMSNSVGWMPLSEADALSVEPGFYTLDSENIAIEGLHRTRPDLFQSPFNGRWVQRGVAGSTAASHTSGASVTRYYPDAPGGGGGGGVTVTGSQGGSVAATEIAMPGLVSDLGGGTAGVGLVLQQLGPVSISYNTVGEIGGPLNDFGYKKVLELPDGAHVLLAWASPTTDFVPTDVHILIGVAPSDAVSISGNLVTLDPTGWLGVAGVPLSGSAWIQAAANQDSPYVKQVIKATTNSALWVFFDMPTDPASAGAADICAIIAAPAS